MNTTPEYDGFLSSLLKDSRIPSLYEFVLPSDYDEVSMPARFKKSSYSHPFILDIFGHVLTIWLVVGVVLSIALVLTKSECAVVRKIATKIKDNFVYNGLIRMLLESCVYIFLGSLLNIRYGISGDFHSILNTIVSFSFLLLFCIFGKVAY